MTGLSDTVVLERTLFSETGVWFYQIPAGQVTNLAPRADSWDPEHPFLTGSLRVLQIGDACYVQLFEPVMVESEAATLFAQCPLQITRDLALDVYVHDCADSSRYFMLRVEDEKSGRRAFVGIGFPDRTAAFNFKATLQDYAKYTLRQLEVQEGASPVPERATTGEVSKSNLSLPEGATIRINLKTKGSDNAEKENCRSRSTSGGNGAAGPAKIPLIPPPPTSGKMPTAPDDEDWGEFTSA
ncbi:hypothetical protein PsorP6_008246 [Peronosclerospora sorghi]|uniref:Uncharacterized protein n=1 Tax=Peronosclerospora sorghi TaxID=230839 RepID=A0ACC0W9N5_9STRA|nr:hypothetical protein PsorP6_008246 [Peronosclerospora sorghi]